MALLELYQLKQYLKIDEADEDLLLQDIIDEVEALFLELLGRAVESEERDERVTARGQRTTLFLKHFPVDEDADFTVYDMVNEEEIDADYYDLDPEIGEVVHESQWESGTRQYRITYTGGLDVRSDYDTVVLPAIRRAIRMWAADTYYHRSPRALAEKLGDESVTLEGIDMPRQTAQVLTHYRVKRA